MLAVAEKPAAYSESALAVLWSRAHTLVDALVTQDGSRLQVVYPGRQNRRAGPDFHDAVLLSEDGKAVRGDVELHIDAPGWYNHNHHTDPNYNGVVLHVVLSPKGHQSSRQRSGMEAPVAGLEAVATSLDAASVYASAVLPALGMPHNDVAVGEMLDAAGDERFHSKSRGFALDIQGCGADEAVYRGLMDALGYASNRNPFRLLAQRLPYCRLVEMRSEPPATRLMAIKAMLLGASGLMHLLKEHEDLPQLKRIYKRLPKVKPVPKRDWKLFRVRPANHPVRRILGAALIVDGCLDDGITATLTNDLLHGGVKVLVERLEAKPYVGKARARDMLLNVVLPFMHAYAVVGGVSAHGRRNTVHRMDALSKASLDAYAALPKLQENEITREMRRLCGISKGMRINARRQQGLIHLYKTRVRGMGGVQQTDTG